MLSNFFAWQLNCVAKEFKKEFLSLTGLKNKNQEKLKDLAALES